MLFFHIDLDDIDNISLEQDNIIKVALGQKFVITDRNKVRSVEVATQSIYITFGLYTEHFLFKQGRLNKLFGSNQLFQLLRGKLRNNKGKLVKSPPELLRMINDDSEKFSVKSASYYLYN